MPKSYLEREHERHASKFHKTAACGKTEAISQQLGEPVDLMQRRYTPFPYDAVILIEVPRFLPAMMFGEFAFEWEHPLYKKLSERLSSARIGRPFVNAEPGKPWSSETPIMPPVYGSDVNDLPMRGTPQDLAFSVYDPHKLNQLARDIHVNDNAKWWHDLKTGEKLDRNEGEMLMLVVSEIAEAMEGLRKDAMDDKLPYRKMEEVELADAIIRILDYAYGTGLDLDANMPSTRFMNLMSDNRSEELLNIVRCIIRCSVMHSPRDKAHYLGYALRYIKRYADHYGFDLIGAIKAKRAFNRTRKDHSVEARLAAGGKKF